MIRLLIDEWGRAALKSFAIGVIIMIVSGFLGLVATPGAYRLWPQMSAGTPIVVAALILAGFTVVGFGVALFKRAMR